MPYLKRRNVKRKSAPKRKLFRKKSTKVSAPVRTYVNRLISRNEETKFVSTQYALTSFNSGINAIGDLVTVLPPIQQGLTQSTRIGNSIRPIKMVITGYVIYNASALSALQDARMLGARLFCFQDKSTRSYTNSSVLNYNLLDIGGTSNNFTGSALNYCQPHNNDLFTFFADKKMKILKPFGYTNNAVPSSSSAITGMDNSMYQPFRIVLTKKHLPAVLHYDQNNNVSYPTNFAPFLALGYCDFFNVAPDTTTTQLSMEFVSTLYYKDA